MSGGKSFGLSIKKVVKLVNIKHTHPHMFLSHIQSIRIFREQLKIL